MKKRVKIKFQNGITHEIATREILNELLEEYDFVESSHPDFIIFGPYGNDIPKKGNYIRVGYFCENITPDLSICEWAFGVPREEEVNHPKYTRIQWHGLEPSCLLKSDPEKYLSKKTSFCNFLYSHPVAYREEFFKQLSKYKKVDAPGKSMNNMPSIDSVSSGNLWTRKKDFLSTYKFTIAFENYCYPGYQTEKLYDAMQANSLPIYCGDPDIHKIFNTNSFINIPDYIDLSEKPLVLWLQKYMQMDFDDIRPQFFKTPIHHIKRKIKKLGRELKMHLQYKSLDFSDAIDRIVEIDKDPELYLKYLGEPWFNNNEIPVHLSTKRRWQQIFDKMS